MASLVEGGWDLGLRDASLETWSRPNKSKKLDNVFKKKTTVAAASQPKLHSKEAVAIHAATLEEEKRLMMICQKTERTDEEVKFAQSYMCQFAFFRLWPEPVQRELARVLLTEVRVCHETIISRGTPLTKVFFLLRGLLQVSVPQASEPGLGDTRPSVGTSPAQADPSTRVLATLRKGDTCGEAVLLGNCMAHADVVVTSPGAVLLSLCHADFLRALKEILGLRQQDRLMYLRMHPLFVEVALEDLDRASDMLNLAFFPPGSLMYSPKSSGPDSQRVYFIAEGQCAVKRHGASSHGPGAAAMLQLDAERAVPAYDGDTVSVLGPLEVFGLEGTGSDGRSRSHGGWVVESLTQVKAYYLTLEQFAKLPKAMQKVVQDASEFKARYLRGRAHVLNRLDDARRNPHYGAMTYSLGDAKLTTVGHLPPPSRGRAASPGAAAGGAALGGAAARVGTSRAARSPQPGANKVSATLEKLAAGQVRELLQLDAAREAAASVGLPPYTAHDLLATGNVSSLGATARSLRETAPRGAIRPHSPHSPRLQQQQQQQQLGSMGQAGQGSSPPKHAPGPSTVKLNILPPDTTTWSRLDGARNRSVVTEAPRIQPVPTSLRQRHAAVFRTAQQVAHRVPGRAREGSESDDDQLIDRGLYVNKQASRRLSARLRHSDERGGPASASWYDGRSGPSSAAGPGGFIGSRGMATYTEGSLPPNRDWVASSGPGHSIDRDLRAALISEDLQQEADATRGQPTSAGGLSGSGGGGLNQTLRKGSGLRGPVGAGEGAAGATGSDSRWGQEHGGDAYLAAEQAPSHQQQQQHQQQQREQQQQQQQQHSTQHQHRQPERGQGRGHAIEPDAHDVTDLQDMHERGRVIRHRPGKGGAPAGSAQQQQQRQHHAHDPDSQDSGGGPGGGAVVGLPASVVLGYENLDPFQWAALMSHVAPGSRGQQGNQESVLPKPKW